MLKIKADKYTRSDFKLAQDENATTDFLATGTRIERSDDVVHESDVKLSGEIQQGL